MKKQITQHNYEAFLLDFMENQLSEHEKEQLFAFMKAHPEFKDDYEFALGEGWPELVAEEIGYPLVEKSKITSIGELNAENYEEFFIASMEGLLTQEQQENVQVFIQQNPITKKEFEAYNLTKLNPDTQVVFPHKEKLKKGRTIFLFRKTTLSYAAAAVLLLLIGFTFWNQFDQTKGVEKGSNKVELANKNTKPEGDGDKPSDSTDKETTPSDEEVKENFEKENPNREVVAPHEEKNKQKEKRRIEDEYLQTIPQSGFLALEIPVKRSTTVKIKGSFQAEPAPIPFYDPEIESPITQKPTNNEGYASLQEVVTGTVKKKLSVDEEEPVEQGLLALLKRGSKKLLKTDFEVTRDTVSGKSQLVAITTPFFEIERSK